MQFGISHYAGTVWYSVSWQIFLFMYLFINLKTNLTKVTNNVVDQGSKYIAVGRRTMTGQKFLLTCHFFTSPVILTDHIFMPFNVIADVLNHEIKK